MFFIKKRLFFLIGTMLFLGMSFVVREFAEDNFTLSIITIVTIALAVLSLSGLLIGFVRDRSFHPHIRLALIGGTVWGIGMLLMMIMINIVFIIK